MAGAHNLATTLKFSPRESLPPPAFSAAEGGGELSRLGGTLSAFCPGRLEEPLGRRQGEGRRLPALRAAPRGGE